MEINVTTGDDHVAVVEFDHPPHNHFDIGLLSELADTYERLGADGETRAIVLCGAGRHFCAGADFGGGELLAVRKIYEQAYRLFAAPLPVVAAVQGAAVGGGLGLALSADFRVASESARFVPNFARLGIHHGFGMTVTLPRVIGPQKASELLYTGRMVKAPEALELGLTDGTAPEGKERDEAKRLAVEIARSAPLAVRSIRATLRADLAEQVRHATDHEAAEQAKLFATKDFQEGVAATSDRRLPNFTGS